MIKKPETVILLVSIGVTTLIATLFGFAGSAIIGTFWAWFWITILLQVIIFAITNSYFLQKDKFNEDRLTVQTLEQFAKFTIKLNCSYCQQPSTIPIQLNQRNTFKCESCNQINGVTMQFISTPLTTPIESVSIPIENSESIEFKVSR